MRSAKRIETDTGLAPAGLYFRRVAQNLRSTVSEQAPARHGAAPSSRTKRAGLMN